MRHILLAAAILAAGACSNQSTPPPASHARVATPPAAMQAAVARAMPEHLPALRSGGIASLPDRGTLVAYPRATPIHDTAYTWRPVSVSENHAIAAIARGELVLTAPDGSPIRLRYARHIEHPDGNWTWIGSPEGATPGNEAIITFGPDAVFGTIPTRSGDTLRLTTIRGKTWMLETDAAAEARLGMNGADPSGRSDARIVPRLAGARADAADMGVIRTAAAPATGNASASPANTVDLLVGYTAQFAARFGGASGANTRLTFLVDVANQAYASSQVDGALRLVGTLQVNYTETNSNGDALYELTGVACTEQSNGSLSCNDAPVPAGLAPLVAKREELGADVVSLVRNFDSATQQGCGIAWLLGAGQSGIAGGTSGAAVEGDDDYGYSVVSDSNGDSGGSFPSGGFVCRDEALAHEVGHNMGLQHDRTTAADADGVLQPEEFGVFPYSFGYRGGSANVYTVMAYGTTGLHKVRVFSNPNIACTWSGAVPAAACGVADQADNARALRQTLPIVATFRAMVAKFGDVNFDYWAFDEIRRLSNAGITNGCSAATSTSLAMFCPEAAVTREQMAAFLVRARYGASFVPPAATGVFSDVPASNAFAPYIEQLARDGVTTGCATNPARFCPSDTVLRDQMAVFLTRARYGANYTPPPMSGLFTDVPGNYWAGTYIEKLFNDGITGGCSASPPMFCPTSTVTRAQMAAFLVRAYGL